MRLTGPEYTKLASVLGDAFVDYQDLGVMLRRAGRRIQDITPPGPMATVVDAIIGFAETRDWVHELVAAARAANPGNAGLLEISAAIGLEPGGVPPGAVPPERALSEVSARLERMVDPQRGIADLGSFAARLHELMGQVCAVELGNEFGTGFLIGPETVLTNHHVVAKAIAGEFDPAGIRLRFDFQRLRDGLTTNAGVVFDLADGWLVHAEKPSAVDRQVYSEAAVPAANELDYAVLRTRDKIGRQPPSGPVEAERGWLVPRAQPYDFPPDTFLMVVQHPCHDPISFDEVDDAVLRVNANGTRVHYRTNTLPGSSGSPVLDRQLELVALHHAGEPGSPDVFLPCNKQLTPASYNEGIPIDRIQAHLAGQGHAWVFGSDAP
jgi:hypothetical protein